MKIEAAAANTPKLQCGTAARLAKPGEAPVESLLASCGWEADELAPLETVAVEPPFLPYPEPLPVAGVVLEPLALWLLFPVAPPPLDPLPLKSLLETPPLPEPLLVAET